MTRYAVLFGFGLFRPSKSTYKGYLDRFARFVKRNKIDVVVLCGGHTNIRALYRSEAGTMRNYLRPIIGDKVKIRLESRSLTTEQNIRYAKKFIDLDPGNKIFVFTESVRFFKVTWFLLHSWFGLERGEIMDYWFAMMRKIYGNPEKRETTIRLRDVRPLLFYKNVRVVVDRFHKDYKSALQIIVSEPFEIDALYDRKVYDKLAEIARKKFRMS